MTPLNIDRSDPDVGMDVFGDFEAKNVGEKGKKVEKSLILG